MHENTTAAPVEAPAARPERGEDRSDEERQRRGHIAIAAYYRAEQRAFAPGHEMDDWLQAEQELAGAQANAGRDADY